LADLLAEPVSDPIASVSDPVLTKAASHVCDCADVRARLRSVTRTRRFEMAATINGTIKRLVSEKGFGFVAASDGSEYFFHQSACNGCKFDNLREGQAVTFDKTQGPKGPRAENVRLA
jgi:cold shock protein